MVSFSRGETEKTKRDIVKKVSNMSVEEIENMFKVARLLVSELWWLLFGFLGLVKWLKDQIKSFIND